ncbi:HAT, C-terminal dimerization domain containing protein [Parasponia andersonii]|uniref:HAT, C-terminal dimerization domain containing protein n=1 Tax=Parasponia andersonii TaxID=3476 RepID=A0A2P5BQ68_PARAD|nr:HAT, C-terminal dimerization domain containing protein [Parasponia andersonii]
MDGGAKSCNPISSTRGVRCHMDRFIVNLDDEEEDVRNKAAPIQQNSKEMWNQVCLDVGRIFQSPEIKLSLFHCTDKLIPDPEHRVKANLQCSVFHNKEGFFEFNQAKLTFDKRSPIEWWIRFGDGTPELQRFAIKVLGLTCSSSGCERNWSTYNQVHTKRRNRLSTLRMNTWVYIMYNKKLKHRQLKLKSLQNDEDALSVNELPSDDEWLIGENDEEDSPKTNDDELDVDVFGEGGLPSEVSGIQSQSTKSHKKNTPETSKAGGKRKKHVTDVDENEEGSNDLNSDDGEDDRAIRYDNTSENPSSHDDLDDY